MIPRSETKNLAILFGVVFCCTIFSMTVAREIVIPRMLSSTGGHISGDPQIYNNLALKKSAEMKLRGWAAFELRPEGHGPAGIASLVYLFVESPYGIVALNAILHALSVLIMVLILRLWFSLRTSILAALPLAVSPAMMCWFSQLNKDSFVLTGSLLFVYGLLRLLGRGETVRNFLGCVLAAVSGTFLIGLTKPYVNQMLVPVVALILVSVLVCRLRDKTRSSEWMKLTLSLFFLLSCLRLFSRGAASDEKLNYLLTESPRVGMHSRLSSVDESRWRNAPFLPDFVNKKLRILMGQRCVMLTLLDEQTNSTTLASFVDADVSPGGSLAALAYFPRGSLNGIFSPWPDRWLYALRHRSFFYSIVPVETAAVYLGLVGLVLWFIRRKARLILVPVALSFFMMTIFGVATPFIGTLYRYRYPWWMLLLCLGLAAWISLIKSQRQNSMGEGSSNG